MVDIPWNQTKPNQTKPNNTIAKNTRNHKIVYE